MSIDSYTEKQLISGLKAGNRKIYRFIYLQHYNNLCVYLCSYTNNEQLVEDIVQNVLLKLWEKRRDINIHTSIKNYLYRAVYNTFIDDYRKTKRINEKLETIRFNGLNELIENDKQLEEERLIILRKALDSLPPKCKEILLLSKFEGYKYREIAEHLNISIKTVENQIVKAFKVLRKEIKKNNILSLFLSFLQKQHL